MEKLGDGNLVESAAINGSDATCAAQRVAIATIQLKERNTNDIRFQLHEFQRPFVVNEAPFNAGRRLNPIQRRVDSEYVEIFWWGELNQGFIKT